jgi:hypothetical protein
MTSNSAEPCPVEDVDLRLDDSSLSPCQGKYGCLFLLNVEPPCVLNKSTAGEAPTVRFFLVKRKEAIQETQSCTSKQLKAKTTSLGRGGQFIYIPTLPLTWRLP